MSESLPIEHLAAFRDYCERQGWKHGDLEGMQAVHATKPHLTLALVLWHDGDDGMTAVSAWSKAELKAFKEMYGIK